MIAFIIGNTGLILLLSGFIMTILFLHKRKQFLFRQNIEDIKVSHEKNLLRTQLEIQEQTLMNVSRDIHDNISLSLTLSKLYLNSLSYADPAEIPEKISISASLIGEAIQNLSNISKSLNTDIINHFGLLKAIENEIAALRKTGLFEIQYEVSGIPVFMECQKELILFRIVQEAFNNIIKHAQAKKISLHLRYGASQLELQVSDDGIGFSPEHIHTCRKTKPTAGLNNIRQRTKMLNGACCIDNIPGSGAAIKISVPF
ncbi:MAG TPA: ATP-binding protein [Flavitalea sp.]|nr:ATP-binding protein [Flavitalea sp.]